MSFVRSGPLTWSQRWWIDGLPESAESSYEDNLYAEVPVGPAPLDAVVLAVRDVLARHENLRSRLDLDRPDRRLQIVEAPDSRISEAVVVVDESRRAEAVREARRTCFRADAQWPVTVLVFAEGGTVSGLGVLVDHWAADGWSLNVVRRDLSEAVAARAAGVEWSGSGPVEQPIDVAVGETSTPAGAAQLDWALQHWRDQLVRLNRDLKGHRGLLATGGAPEPGPQFRSCRLTSRAALRSASETATRLNVPVSAVFLAAFGAAICEFERSPAAGVFMLSANRLSGRARRSVRNAIMQAPVVLPSTDSAGFAEIVTSAARQQARGHRRANADPARTDGTAAEILGDVWRSCVAGPRFNYMSHEAVGGEAAGLMLQLGSAPDGGAVSFSEPRAQGAQSMLSVNEVLDRVVITLRWHTNTGWGSVAEPMLRSVEDFVSNGMDGR